MKSHYKGFELRAAVTAAAHKICAALQLQPVTITWSAEIPTAAMSQHGAMYLADIKDDATLGIKVLHKYVGYVIHELLHRKYTNFSASDPDQYISTLHNAIEDIWIERLGIAAGLTGNISEVMTVLIEGMVQEALDNVSDWSAPGQYPFALAVYGRRYAATKVPLAQGLEPIFAEASKRIDDCSSSYDTLEVARWVFKQLKTLPQKKQPKGQEDKPGKPGQGKPEGKPGKQGQEGQEQGQGDSEATTPPPQPTGPATSPTDGQGKTQEAVCVEPKTEAPDGTGGAGSYNAESGLRTIGSYTHEFTTRKISQVNAARIKFEVRKLFEMSGLDEYQTGRKSGSVNVRALPRLATSNGRVFKRRLEQDGIDSAVVIVLDVSSSMTDWDHIAKLYPIDIACSTVNCLLDVLKSAGVSTSVLAFGYQTEVLKPWGMTVAAAKAKVSHVEPSGSTNDYFAVRYAHEMLLNRSEARRVCFVITDGGGDVKRTRPQVDSGTALGITTVGVGICQTIDHVFPQSIRIDNISELGTASLQQIKLAA